MATMELQALPGGRHGAVEEQPAGLEAHGGHADGHVDVEQAYLLLEAPHLASLLIIIIIIIIIIISSSNNNNTTNINNKMNNTINTINQ